MLFCRVKTTPRGGERAKTDQNDFRFVELLLHLHYRICLSRVLILLQIRRRFREINPGWIPERRLRDFCREIIEQFCQERKRRSDRVFVVAYEHRCIGRAMSAFQTDAGMDHEHYRLTSQLFSASSIVHMGSVRVLLHALALSLRSSFGDGLGEEGDEFRNRSSLIERERRQVRSGGKCGTGLSGGRENKRERVNLHEGQRGKIWMVVDGK